MKKRRIVFRGIQVNFRSGSVLLKTAVLAVIVLSTVALVSIRAALIRDRVRIEALQSEAQYLQQENSRLEQYIAQLGTVQGIIRIAQEELGLVEPGTVLFQTQSSEEIGGSK